jgi:diguanylate cyclase (GGDEF)-like protein
MDENQKKYLNSLKEVINDKEKLLSEFEGNNKALKNILKINNKILEYADMDNLYQYLLDKAVDTIPDATHGSLMKLNEDYTLEIIALHNFGPELLNSKLDLFDSFVWNKTNGLLDKAVIVKSISDFNNEHLSDKQLRTFNEKISFSANTSISAPINIDGSLFGTINVDTNKTNNFTDQDASILMFYANQIASVIKRKTMLDKSLYLSRYDALTNVYNRGYFNLVIAEHEKRARRFREKFSIAIFDIDNLKKINDNYGHNIGDKALKTMVFVVENSIREIDIFARLNDDEFVLVLPEMDTTKVKELINEIREKIQNKTKEKDYKFDFSYGIASYPDESEDVDTLLKLADERMFDYRKINKMK